MTEITEKILENAFCFISESIEKMNQLEKNQGVTEGDQNLKYAICHLWSGIFLLLKARLSKEHWSFLFSKINEATKENLRSGDFKGLYFDDCQKRLSNICSIKFNKEQKNVLDKIKKKRNQAEHYFVTSNRKCNFFVFIDIFKSCIILGLIFQQSFNYHERL